MNQSMNQKNQPKEVVFSPLGGQPDEELVPFDREIDIREMAARTAELLAMMEEAHGNRFPDTGPRNTLYDADLEGRAFAIVSNVRVSDVEDQFNKGKLKTIAKFLVRVWNNESGELGPVKFAQVQGGYAIPQLRARTESELTSYLWTLARDTDMAPYQRGEGWEYPRRLAVWDGNKDQPAKPDGLPWDEQVRENARKIAALSESANTRKR